MKPQVLEIEQGSFEWHKERLGSIGGSRIADVCSKGTGRKTLMYRMVGELLSGMAYQSYQSEAMRRGIEREPEAIAYYEHKKGVTVKRVGLVRSAPFQHCSPDGLVGSDRVLEVKCQSPAIHCQQIDTDRPVSKYQHQCQWNMFITQRKTCDLVSYCPEIGDRPLHIITLKYDDDKATAMHAQALKFLGEMLHLIKKIRRR